MFPPQGALGFLEGRARGPDHPCLSGVLHVVWLITGLGSELWDRRPWGWQPSRAGRGWVQSCLRVWSPRARPAPALGPPLPPQWVPARSRLHTRGIRGGPESVPAATFGPSSALPPSLLPLPSDPPDCFVRGCPPAPEDPKPGPGSALTTEAQERMTPWRRTHAGPWVPARSSAGPPRRAPQAAPSPLRCFRVAGSPEPEATPSHCPGFRPGP